MENLDIFFQRSFPSARRLLAYADSEFYQGIPHHLIGLVPLDLSELSHYRRLVQRIAHLPLKNISR